MYDPNFCGRKIILLLFFHTHNRQGRTHTSRYSIVATTNRLPHPGLLSPLLFALCLCVYVVHKMEEMREVMQIMEDMKGKLSLSPPPLSRSSSPPLIAACGFQKYKQIQGNLIQIKPRRRLTCIWINLVSIIGNK